MTLQLRDAQSSRLNATTILAIGEAASPGISSTGDAGHPCPASVSRRASRSPSRLPPFARKADLVAERDRPPCAPHVRRRRSAPVDEVVSIPQPSAQHLGWSLRTVSTATGSGKRLLCGREVANEPCARLLGREYVGRENLWRRGQELVGVCHERRGDLPVDVRLAGVLAAERVKDPERGRGCLCGIPVDRARLGLGEGQRRV